MANRVPLISLFPTRVKNSPTKRRLDHPTATKTEIKHLISVVVASAYLQVEEKEEEGKKIGLRVALALSRVHDSAVRNRSVKEQVEEEGDEGKEDRKKEKPKKKKKREAKVK